MHGFWLDTLIASKKKRGYGARPNTNIDTNIWLSSDLVISGVTMSKRRAKEGALEEASVQEPKTKRKRQTKTRNKKAREMLQESIRATDKTILVGEVVTALRNSVRIAP